MNGELCEFSFKAFVKNIPAMDRETHEKFDKEFRETIENLYKKYDIEIKVCQEVFEIE